MSDRTNTGAADAAAMDNVPVPQHDHAAAQDNTSAALPFSAREAAAALGVSERTVRRAIQRGEIQATKHAGSFHITSEALESYRLRDSGQSGQGTLSHAATLDNAAAAADIGGSDHAAAGDNRAAAQDGRQDAAGAIAVLRELLSEERRKSDSLLESSLIWQTRALQLQERLAQLEAGPIATRAPERENAPESALEALQRDEAPHMGNETLADAEFDPVPAEAPLATGWRRWWRRVLGYEG